MTINVAPTPLHCVTLLRANDRLRFDLSHTLAEWCSFYYDAARGTSVARREWLVCVAGSMYQTVAGAVHRFSVPKERVDRVCSQLLDSPVGPQDALPPRVPPSVLTTACGSWRNTRGMRSGGLSHCLDLTSGKQAEKKYTPHEEGGERAPPREGRGPRHDVAALRLNMKTRPPYDESWGPVPPWALAVVAGVALVALHGPLLGSTSHTSLYGRCLYRASNDTTSEHRSHLGGPSQARARVPKVPSIGTATCAHGCPSGGTATSMPVTTRGTARS